MATTYAALPRGINVGGGRRAPMADLRALAEGLGHEAVRTHLRSGQAVFTDACPFPADGLQARQLHVTYFSAPAGPERFAGIDREARRPEEFRPGDRAPYLYAPDGLGRSGLAERLARPRVTRGRVATTRNRDTVTGLVELTAA